jgi:hypothetical protein
VRQGRAKEKERTAVTQVLNELYTDVARSGHSKAPGSPHWLLKDLEIPLVACRQRHPLAGHAGLTRQPFLGKNCCHSLSKPCRLCCHPLCQYCQYWCALETCLSTVCATPVSIKALEFGARGGRRRPSRQPPSRPSLPHEPHTALAQAGNHVCVFGNRPALCTCPVRPSSNNRDSPQQPRVGPQPSDHHHGCSSASPARCLQQQLPVHPGGGLTAGSMEQGAAAAASCDEQQQSSSPLSAMASLHGLLHALHMQLDISSQLGNAVSSGSAAQQQQQQQHGGGLDVEWGSCRTASAAAAATMQLSSSACRQWGGTQACSSSSRTRCSCCLLL